VVLYVTGCRGGGDEDSKNSVSAKLWYVVPDARDSDLSSIMKLAFNATDASTHTIRVISLSIKNNKVFEVGGVGIEY
jgi:hypothetical protein